MKKKTGQRRKTIQASFFLLRILSTFLSLIFVILLLPNILKAGWQGSLFLLVFTSFVGLTLWMMLSKNEKVCKSLSFNGLYVASVLYLGLIFSKLFFDQRVKLTMIYEINMHYFENNYLVLSVILLGIIIHGIALLMDMKNVK